MSIVSLSQVSKYYSKLIALDKLDLDITAGEILALLGHNGAGKTTTMKLILGLLRASNGSVKVFGQSPQNNHYFSQQLGYLPENVHFYENLTGKEVLRYFARLKQAKKQQVQALLEQVGLEDAANRRVKTYSKGMRQRLGLAQALLGKPRLLLLDEPTVGLDPLATKDLYMTLDSLRKEGVSIILCSHILPGIERHIDRAVILEHGQLVATGSLEALRQQACLPSSIRVQGNWHSNELQEALRKQAVTVTACNDEEIELQILSERKLEILRYLLNRTDIHNIETHDPMLEELYVYFTRRSMCLPS